MKKENDIKFLDMTREHFDEYMCKIYPKQFRERNMDMTQTCMCWGFDIGCGWYELLDEMCSKINEVHKKTGIFPVFTQIKEKFGGGRFYYDIDNSESAIDKEMEGFIIEYIDMIISRAENEAEHTCETCGKWIYKTLNCYGWVYALHPECYKKVFPDRELPKQYIKENKNEN